MTQLHAVRPARAFAFARDEGDRIWFADTAMTIKATAASTGGELFLMESLIPAGYSPPLHLHHDEHEAFYVLDGELEIVCGTDTFRAGTGAFAFLPSGVAHTFRVVGERPARLLTIALPGGIEEFFRQVGRPAEGPGLPTPEPVDVQGMKQVGSRFNVEIVGPPLASSY